MVTCPVCEHQQQAGAECEVCGKALGGVAAGVPVAVQRLEGLEPTAPGEAGEVPVERLGELEVTRHESPEVPVQRLAEVEQNALPAGPDAPLERLELSEDRAADDGQRTALPTGPVTCRYCRNVQTSGLLCNTCGMRLPRLAGAEVAPVSAGGAPSDTVWARCRSCGAPARAGDRCGDCGREVPFPEV